MARSPAVFLDRDGVINVFPGPGKFVLNREMFEFMPGVYEGLVRLRRVGFALVLITNQSGVGRGLMTLDDLHGIHDKMQDGLGDQALDGIYYCHHHPDEGCDCRKPSPNMILTASEDHGLDPSVSFVIGDSGRDIEMAHNAGCLAVLCRQNLPPSIESMEPRYQPEAFARTFAEAVDWILATADCSPGEKP